MTSRCFLAPITFPAGLTFCNKLFPANINSTWITLKYNFPPLTQCGSMMQGAVSAQQGPTGGGEPLPTPMGTVGCSSATASILVLQKVLS